jgi:hypothetical protein
MATGRTVEELLETLIEVTTRERAPGSDAGVDLSADLAKFLQQVRMSTEHMKKSFVEEKKVATFLKGQQRTAVDITQTLEALDNQLKALDDRVRDSTDNIGKQDALNKKEAIEKQKIEVKAAAAGHMTEVAMHNFGLGLVDVTKSMVTGVLNFAKGLQSGASGVDVGSQLLVDGVDSTNKAIGAAGGLVSAAGGLMQLFSNKYVKIAGGALEVLGIGAGVVSEYLSTLSKEGIKYFQTELKNTVETFAAASQAGALYADGMTGVRNAAFDSGLTMKQFGTVIKENSATLAGMGLSVAEGAKKMGQIMKAGGTEFTKTLRNLGYSVEEQATMVAETMKIMRGSGGGQLKASDAKVAEQTEKYAENLRVIAAITGEDAKKKAEIVKEQASQLAFQQKLAQKSPEQRAQIDRAMQNMTEVERKNFMDMVNFGTVINTQGAIMEAASPALGKSVREMKKSFDEGTLDENKTRQIQGQYNPQQQKELLGNTGIGQAAAAGQGGVVGEVGTGMGKQLQEVNARTPEAIKAAEEAATKQKNTQDPLTKSVTSLEQANQDLAIALGKTTTGALANFADGLKTALGTVEEAVKKLGIDDMKKGKNEKLGGTIGMTAGSAAGTAAGSYGGAWLGGAVGALGGPIGIAIGTTVGKYLGAAAGGLLGGWLGNEAGGAIGKMTDPDEEKPKMAAGGITQGQSIVGEAGPEAVVPLPNQKSIPVHLNAGILADQLTESIAKSQYKQNKQGYGSQGTDYADLPREMQEWIKTRIQYDAYKKITSDEGPNSIVSRDPAHAAKLDAIPKYLEDQNKILKEKYGRDIAQEYLNSQADRAFAMSAQDKKIYGDDINSYYSKLDGMTKMAKGGITDGPSIAGEAGKEAVIPLVGGSVPVTINDKSFLVGKGGLADQTQAITDLSRSLDANINDKSFLVGKGGLADRAQDSEINFKDMKRMVEIAMPPVGMISKAVDFFTKPVEKQQDPLSGADIAKALDANINDKSFLVGNGGLAGQMQPLMDRVAAMPDFAKYQAGGWEADRSMPKSGLSDTNFDTSKLLDAASPMLGMLSKAISTLVDNKNSPADTNKTNVTNVDPGTDMGMGMGSKSNNGAEVTDALKELPGLLKAMISRSDDQLQELRATKNIQQQIANNY